MLDLTDLASDQRQLLASYRFNCLTRAAWGLVTFDAGVRRGVQCRGGRCWIAFNIKGDFLDDQIPRGSRADLVAWWRGFAGAATQRRYQLRSADHR